MTIVPVRKPLWNALATVMAATTPPGGTTIATRALTSTSLRLAAASSSASVQEIELSCSDGTRLAAQLWKRGRHDTDSMSASFMKNAYSRRRTVLCLHGWMDNCRSFYQLAPSIASQDYKGKEDVEFQVVALDFPGHGSSSHKSKDAPPMVQAEMVFYVQEVIEQLLEKPPTENNTMETVTLIGHSLGAAIASLYAASFPERVDQLVLLDGAGFLPREAKETPLHVRNHVIRRRQANIKEQKQQQQQQQLLQNTKPTKGYPSLKAAIARRRQSMKSLPGGNQTLSYEAARELVIRATHEDPHHHMSNKENNIDEDDDDDDNTNNKPLIQFRHDGRFAWPSIQYMTQEQNEAIFRVLGGVNNDEGAVDSKRGVDCGIYIAQDGWPFGQDRMERSLALIRPREFKILPGSHYFHADPDTSQAVASFVVNFLASFSPDSSGKPAQSSS